MTDREKLVKLLDDIRVSCDVPENVDEDGCGTWSIEGADYIADHLLAHGVTVREPGRWVSDEDDVLFHCSECETQISTSWDYDDLQWNFCPNCGAPMDGGADK